MPTYEKIFQFQKRRIMNKNVRRLLFFLIACVLITLPTAFSYMIKETEVVENELTPAIVKCKIEETFDGNKKSDVYVVNEGNIPIYIRAKIVHYWQDSKGSIVGRPSEIGQIPYNSGTLDDIKWIYDQTEDTYYYAKPVEPGDFTDILYNGSIVLESVVETDQVSGVEFTYNHVIEVHAEGIQSLPKKAVEESWKVSIASDNAISNVNPQNQ